VAFEIVGPLPDDLHATRLQMRRPAGPEADPLEIASIFEWVTGETLPDEPEQVESSDWDESRRYRRGDRVAGVVMQTKPIGTSGELGHRARIQHERGGSPAAIVFWRTGGSQSLHLTVVGAELDGGAVVARFREALAKRGWREH
jgi:hypothetical protein